MKAGSYSMPEVCSEARATIQLVQIEVWFSLAITTHYSQWPAGNVAIGAGIPSAYNGKLVGYNQYICTAHLKPYWGTSSRHRVPQSYRRACPPALAASPEKNPGELD